VIGCSGARGHVGCPRIEQVFAKLNGRQDHAPRARTTFARQTRLSNNERTLRDAIEDKRDQWHEYRVDRTIPALASLAPAIGSPGGPLIGNK
jgi:hypothetical protein